jgi:hypothetical protein
MRILIIALAALLIAVAESRAQTDWDALRKLPEEANLEVYELGGRGHTTGKLLRLDDSQLTILRAGRPVVVPRAVIGRIQHRKSDPIWGGLILGVLWGLLATHSYAAEACLSDPQPACTLKAIAVTAPLGAFIDWRIQRRKTVYKSPTAIAITLFKTEF